MSSFKDKLREYKKNMPASQKKAVDGPVREKKIREPEVVEESLLSDEELFLQALANTTRSEAILRKFDKIDSEASPRKSSSGASTDEEAEAMPEKKDIRDQSLFLQWVGDMQKPPEK